LALVWVLGGEVGTGLVKDGVGAVDGKAGDGEGDGEGEREDGSIESVLE
jgi:hypothetical protein